MNSSRTSPAPKAAQESSDQPELNPRVQNYMQQKNWTLDIQSYIASRKENNNMLVALDKYTVYMSAELSPDSKDVSLDRTSMQEKQRDYWGWHIPLHSQLYYCYLEAGTSCFPNRKTLKKTMQHLLSFVLLSIILQGHETVGKFIPMNPFTFQTPNSFSDKTIVDSGWERLGQPKFRSSEVRCTQRTAENSPVRQELGK